MKAANNAKRDKTLAVETRYSRYGVLTVKDFIEKSLADGERPFIRQERDDAAIRKLEQTRDYLRRHAPTGNECHPDTIRLREITSLLSIGVFKAVYCMSQRSEQHGEYWTVISKTAYDYAVGLQSGGLE